MEQIKYTWNEYTKDLKTMIDKLRPYKGVLFESIYGIPRGGLVPAVMLSHALDIPLYTAINRVSKRTLVVDEISDTGQTFMKLSANRTLGYTATLWICEGTEFTPGIYIRSKKKDQYIVFPWEV